VNEDASGEVMALRREIQQLKVKLQSPNFLAKCADSHSSWLQGMSVPMLMKWGTEF